MDPEPEIQMRIFANFKIFKLQFSGPEPVEPDLIAKVDEKEEPKLGRPAAEEDPSACLKVHHSQLPSSHPLKLSSQHHHQENRRCTICGISQRHELNSIAVTLTCNLQSTSLNQGYSEVYI